ncbi:Basal-body rod modification protein FlgD [Fervidicola ferrireducens]|uniref:Basal-body rod modification protein FlgD n=1 Tax=Fervidicola ferrireducens TaxID=520764 RepID=A0A140LAN9_9FIRM|nr:flagellar hook capping FlgD N-terminal domain-containing protein [Fervidicola ferrireducens]KXG77614.1 Basal-body rod modification protein FlgD [Fervidicola ferrireducens]
MNTIENGGILGTTANSGNYTTKKSALSKDDFLKLLITELKFQNPLEPLESKEYIAQLATFSTLEQLQNLNEQISTMSAISLIGKNAKAADEKGYVSGVVKGVSFAQGELKLILGDEGRLVSLKDVFEIS